MALDLSVKSTSPPRQLTKMDEETDSITNDDNNNNNSMCAMNLSIPKLRDLAEGAEAWAQPPNPHQVSNPHQIQLDIAALNLICLARLQETAAVLTGHRPPPAHGNGSSFPLVNSNNNNRRNHKCDEPGCDKVNICNLFLHLPFVLCNVYFCSLKSVN